MTLWHARGELGEAERRMQDCHAAALPGASVAVDASLGALLSSAIIEHRRNLVLAHRALVAKGTPITLSALQRFYYAQWRRLTEAGQICRDMDVEMDTDDGLDDHCAICQQRGQLLVCDACSSVYHLACVGLRDVPEGEWKCYVCLEKPPIHTAPPSLSGGASLSQHARHRPLPAAMAMPPPPTPPPRPKPGQPPTAAAAASNGGSPSPAPRAESSKPHAPNGSSAPLPAAAPRGKKGGGVGGGGSRKRRSEASEPPVRIPAKRVFCTADGRMYEQDPVTGKVMWCEDAVDGGERNSVPYATVVIAPPPTAKVGAAGATRKP